MKRYILSCDCATRIFGWAIIDKDNFALVDYGEIKCDDEDTLYRTNYMVDELQKVVKKYNKETGTVVLSNPHDTRYSIEVPLPIIEQYLINCEVSSVR